METLNPDDFVNMEPSRLTPGGLFKNGFYTFFTRWYASL
jgi:hypothetical protein